MKILLTDHSLRRLGGAQSVIRELCRGLRDRGHDVLAYCAVAPPPGDSLASDLVPVIASLRDLPFEPDVIHAHSHLDGMAAVLALNGVPAIYHCHGGTHVAKQPRHPRIVRYVAMSPTLRLRMATESGIEENDIDVVLNAVDLARFRVVRDPPVQLRRALVYKRKVDPGDPVGREIREAAARAGLQLDFRGIGPGLRPMLHPERELPGFDLVFTSGKAALEALASGCAVVVIGNTACGELVVDGNFDRLRHANFSPPVNSPPPEATRILRELGGYRAEGAAAISRRVRAVAGLDAFIDETLAVYARGMEAWRGRPASCGVGQRAAADYLRSLAPIVELAERPARERLDPPPLEVLRRRLVRQVAALPADDR